MQMGTRGSGQAEVGDQRLHCSTAPVVQVNQHRELRVLAFLNVVYTTIDTARFCYDESFRLIAPSK